MCACSHAIPWLFPNVTTPAIVRLVIVACSLAAACAQAQTGIASNGAVATIGAPLGRESQSANTLLLGTVSSFSYDNNALNSTPGVHDFILASYPEIGLNMLHRRWGATLTYIPGLSYSTANIPSYDLISHAFGGTASYRATHRLTLDFRESFSSSTNPFDSLRNASLLPQFGVLNTPTAVTWNLIPKTIETAEAKATYKFTGRTTGFARGDYQYLDYQHTRESTGSLVVSQQSNSGVLTLGLDHQLSTRFTTGAQFTSQILDFGGGDIRTNAQTLAFQVHVSLTPTIVISAIAGPQYVVTRQTLINEINVLMDSHLQNNKSWSWMGGGAMSWNGHQNSLSASVIRQLATGTGLQGNVRETIASIQMQHKVGKHASLDAFTTYSSSDPLIATRVLPGTANSYLSAGGAITRNFTDNLSVGFTAWVVRQNGGPLVDAQYSGNHNRAAISLSYQIVRPLRRG